MVKNPPANVGDTDLVPELERFPGGEHGKPLQYSCLGNPMDRGAIGPQKGGLDVTELLNA